MAMKLENYKNELESLEENKKVCVENSETLGFQKMFVSSLVKENNKNEELLRLQNYVNDRFFVNDEMVIVLNLAIKHLKTEKEMNCAYSEYMDRYNYLTKRIIKISKEPDFKDLANKYLPLSNENGINM